MFFPFLMAQETRRRRLHGSFSRIRDVIFYYTMVWTESHEKTMEAPVNLRFWRKFYAGERWECGAAQVWPDLRATRG
ncbi:MAG: hypothetical protein KHX36_06180 [Clostridiales bacterium]|nr:hypothetical protein [Clostridiales bacterium]